MLSTRVRRHQCPLDRLQHHHNLRPLHSFFQELGQYRAGDLCAPDTRRSSRCRMGPCDRTSYLVITHTCIMEAAVAPLQQDSVEPHLRTWHF